MEIRFRSSFNRELRRIRDPNLRRRVERAIEDVRTAPTVSEIPRIRRLSSSGNLYRIRVGDYRIGLEVKDDVAILVRFGHRREIYRSFP